MNSKNMVEVIPAIMPKSLADLEEKIGQVVAYVKTVQLDIMDGVFVPDKTWPYPNYPAADFSEILEEKSGLPHFESLDYEVDLMVVSPERDARDWILAGAKRIIIHIESGVNIKDVFEKFYREYGTIKDNPVAIEISVAISSDTPLSVIDHIIPLVDSVQFMGIKRIGFQGESFDHGIISKIETLRKAHPKLIISVDGGVNEETARLLVEKGVSRLVSGSYIFESENTGAAIENLKNIS